MNPKSKLPSLTEPKELHLVADTNLFFECMRLEQLPWHELNAHQIVILITKPVLDEIDKHKKANGRTRTRAIDIFSRIREALKTGVSDIVVRASAPRVVMRQIGDLGPDETLREKLDFLKNDDRLVAILSAIINQNSGIVVELFTDDTGPASTARGLSLPFRFIDDSWRRPAEQTTEAKRIQELEKDLQTYRRQEPNIEIQANLSDGDNCIEVVQKIVRPLSKEEIENVIDSLTTKYPLERDFIPPPTIVTINPRNEAVEHSYSAPNTDDIARYQNEIYPNWVEECRTTLSGIHRQYIVRDKPVIVVISAWNSGTRPASQVLIEFTAEGEVELLRHDDEEHNDREVATQLESVKGLPMPPQPPEFIVTVTKIETQAQKADIDSITSIDRLASETSSLSASLLKMHSIGDAFKTTQEAMGFGSYATAARIMAEQNKITDLITPYLSSLELNDPLTFHPPVMPQFYPESLRPPKHDPEAFYYDEWPIREPVKRGALTCDLWRHQTSPEEFEFEVVFTKSGNLSGAILCNVHAENLTRPRMLRIPIFRKIEECSPINEAYAMVDRLEHNAGT